MADASKKKVAHMLSGLENGLKLGFAKARPMIVAVLLAFLIGALVILLTGDSPFGAYAAMVEGAFGSRHAIGETLRRATPIIFTALAFLFAFRCGLFNIGVEGQLLVGGFASAWVGFSFSGLPVFIHLPLALLAGAAVGGLWALGPAVLKAKLGVHEVITTMMLTFVALHLTSYLVNYPFKAPSWVPHTPVVAPSAQLPRILPPSMLTASIFLALACVVAMYFILWKTTTGYEVRLVGTNPSAAKYAGIRVPKKIILAMCVSGLLGGLGGAGEVLGTHGRFIEGFSPGYGWDGIAAGLVGRLHPIGVIFSAILFGALRSGSAKMDMVTGVPFDIAAVIQAIVILFVAAPMLIRYLTKRCGLKW